VAVSTAGAALTVTGCGSRRPSSKTEVSPAVTATAASPTSVRSEAGDSDTVSVDAYATTLFGMTGQDIEYLRMGAEMGLGEMDLNKVCIERIQV
jgi:hypothetical protein